MHDKTICGLDVGSSKIRAVIAQFKPTIENETEQKPQILGIGEADAVGVRRGLVVDLGQTAKAIRKAVAAVERSSGVSFGPAFVGVGGCQIGVRASKGVVAVSRADGEISQEDMDRAVGAASAISIPQNREVLHVLPRRFSVDDETEIKDPVGMHGVRLEVDALIVDGSAPYIKNLTKCVDQAGVEIVDLILAPLASSLAVLSRRQKELGVMVLDIGGGTSGLTVFEEGDIIHAAVLPLGSGHITNDIAIGLRTSIDVAEKIKIEFGSALPEEIDKKEQIDLSKLGDENIQVPRKRVAEIIQARVDEILELTGKELRKIDRQGLLPGGVVIVGAGAKLPGLVDAAKDRLGLPAQIGFPQEVKGVIDEVDDPSFANVCGLVFWSLQDYDEHQSSGFSPFDRLGRAGKGVLAKLKRFFKNLLP